MKPTEAGIIEPKSKESIGDIVKKYKNLRTQIPYVKVFRNGICTNPITRTNPYLHDATPQIMLSPRGSKFHK